MKICITSSGRELSSAVDGRFGRCRYFCIFDTEAREARVIENQGALSQGGAGIAAAQQVADEGVEIVITGNLGPNAMNVLNSAGIKAYRAEGTDIANAVEMCEAGQLQPIGAPVSAHYGMQQRRGGK
jgi:predicted Fe-Mo cluster-binding NifX family protein